MGGPGHYYEAERLIELAEKVAPSDQVEFTARAQVHATLALVAATVSSHANEAWREAVA